jgi:hypothetical protein
MSQQDNFSGGFLIGAILGGIAGGVLGAMLANRRQDGLDEGLPLADGQPKAQRRPLRVAGQSAAPSAGQSADAPSSDIEAARHSLEDKIAQLNDAIDDVRHQLNGVNGRSGDRERTLSED